MAQLWGKSLPQSGSELFRYVLLLRRIPVFNKLESDQQNSQNGIIFHYQRYFSVLFDYIFSSSVGYCPTCVVPFHLAWPALLAGYLALYKNAFAFLWKNSAQNVGVFGDVLI
jgi:hypothetical protein